jgi:hypothetical protein
LERRVDVDAPNFEQSKETKELHFKCDDRLFCTLFDVNELEYLAKRIDGIQGMKILINVGDHLESLLVKSRIFDKEV